MKKFQTEKTGRKTLLKSIILVVISTIFTALGQTLIKYSTGNLSSVYSIFTNIPLIIGFVLYAFAAALLVSALREHDLSAVFPFIALSFIWVILFSYAFLGERIIFVEGLGIFMIILGVISVGLGAKNA